MNIFHLETAFQIIIDKLSDDNLLPKDIDVLVVFELPREASRSDIATKRRWSWQNKLAIRHATG